MKQRSSAGVSRRRVGGLRVVNGGMDLDANAATALLSALGLAREHGGAASALAAADIELPASERFLQQIHDPLSAGFGGRDRIGIAQNVHTLLS